MRSELVRLRDTLESVMQDPASHAVDDIERIFVELVTLRDPDSIGPFALLLDDAGSDALNFSIVHSIEKFDDTVYIDHIVAILPALARRSPRWAMILHMRILNSDSARAAYLVRLQCATPDEREAAVEVLDRVRSHRPQFDGRVEAILQNS